MLNINAYSRNRDENGDGKIDGEELKWYLPAVNQCTYYWFGMNSLPEDARIKMEDRVENSYWNSTKAHAKWWAAEGSAYGPNENNSIKNKVRCVRSLKTYNADVTDVSVYDPINRVVTMKVWMRRVFVLQVLLQVNMLVIIEEVI